MKVVLGGNSPTIEFNALTGIPASVRRWKAARQLAGAVTLVLALPGGG
jgi:hypothetical protein